MTCRNTLDIGYLSKDIMAVKFGRGILLFSIYIHTKNYA